MTLELPGSVRIAPRALRQAVRAVAAETLGAPPSEVRAEVLERGGSLALRIAGPMRRTHRPLLAAAEDARRHLLERAGAITGAELAGCELRITACIAHEAPRAR